VVPDVGAPAARLAAADFDGALVENRRTTYDSGAGSRTSLRPEENASE